MSDLRQSREYQKYMESLGWEVEGGVFIKKLGRLCWFGKYQRPDKVVNFSSRALFLKIEPNTLRGDEKVASMLDKMGFWEDKSPMLPTKTIWINLRKSKEKLLSEMRTKTRYNIKKHRQKITVIRGDKIREKDLRDFYEIYFDNSRRQKFWGLKLEDLKSLFENFKKKAYLLKTDESGLLLLVHDKVAYYSHNASSKLGRKKFVPTTLVWEAIKLAKKLKCTRFDFEGIEDERYPVTRKWSGFSRFKMGFGGEVVEYLGSFSKFNCPTIFLGRSHGH